MKFVIQEHWAEKAGHHFDFRLEMDGVAKSWVIKKGFPKKGEKRLAIQVDDHSVEYMDFEGVIPFGYGKGRVEIWDKGEYDLIERRDKLIKFRLKGKKVSGEYVLVRFPRVKNGWLLIKV